MKTVKIAAIKARAERLHQPDMIERYRELALNEDEHVIELTDEDNAALNAMWNETGRSGKRPAPCSDCGGLQ